MQPPIVAAARVSRADFRNQLTLTAEFEPFQDVDVMAKVSGYVHAMRVDIGDRVHAGQVLATLDVPEMADDLARTSAAAAESRAELTTAHDEVARAEAAHQIAHLSAMRLRDVANREPGLVPEQDVDEAHARDLVAEAQVASATSHEGTVEQRIRVADAEHARAATLQRYAVITAPFDGVVTKRYANVGALIQAGTASQTQAMPIVRLSQNGLLRLTIPVPESAAAAIHVGQTVVVRLQSIDRTFDGRVARLADKVQMSTRTMDAEIDVPNPMLTLIPGMYAQADVTVEAHPHALFVPVDAVEGLGSAAPRVYLVTPDATIRIVDVKTGLETPSTVEILQGVHDGDIVVTGRRAALANGARVRPKLPDAVNGAGSVRRGE